MPTHCLRNRLFPVLIHTTRYSFQPVMRLAKDSGISHSAISRMLAGKTVPSVLTIIPVLAAVEKEIGRALDVRELVSADGMYPTASVCALVGCPRTCVLPSNADEYASLLAQP